MVIQKGLPCPTEQCDSGLGIYARGVCRRCYNKLLNGITPGTGKQYRKYQRIPWIGTDGYVYIHDPTHPFSTGNNMFLHRLVYAIHLGRRLLRSENIHHINGDTTDNRLENLELWSTSQPSGQRVEDKVQWAVDLLKTYKPEALASTTEGD